jgi:hypothetical protein
MAGTSGTSGAGSVGTLPTIYSSAQQEKYFQLGLTYRSNETNIVPRNSAGNIQLQEQSDTNPLLIIEPVAQKITTISALKIIDTQFNYYKFPVRTKVVNVNTDIDLTSDLVGELANALDPVYARYRPAGFQPWGAGPGINDYSGLFMNQVVDGLPQQNVNAYTVTPNIKQSGADLRIRVKMNHGYVGGNNGNFSFSIIKAGPNTPLDRSYITFDSNNGIIPNGSYFVTTLDTVIQNATFEAGDAFSIGGRHGQSGHVIYPTTTYFVITDASKNVDEWNQEI